MKKIIVDNKIFAIVKFNSGEGLILEKPIKLTYYKFNNFIIGTDGLFVVGYFYETPSERWKAFGGRKFDIELHDGTIEKCHGQWWDGFKKEALEYIGDEIIHVVCKSYDELKECYVYAGYSALKKPFEEFRKTYTGTIHEYYTGEYLVKSVKPSKLKKWLGNSEVLDVQHCVYKFLQIDGKTHYKYLYSLDENLQHMNNYCDISRDKKILI